MKSLDRAIDSSPGIHRGVMSDHTETHASRNLLMQTAQNIFRPRLDEGWNPDSIARVLVELLPD
jgi:hypothetical protein